MEALAELREDMTNFGRQYCEQESIGSLQRLKVFEMLLPARPAVVVEDHVTESSGGGDAFMEVWVCMVLRVK